MLGIPPRDKWDQIFDGLKKYVEIDNEIISFNNEIDYMDFTCSGISQCECGRIFRSFRTSTSNYKTACVDGRKFLSPCGNFIECHGLVVEAFK